MSLNKPISKKDFLSAPEMSTEVYIFGYFGYPRQDGEEKMAYVRSKIY